MRDSFSIRRPLLGALVPIVACTPPMSSETAAPLVQANQLVQQVERLRDLPSARLGKNNQVAFGTLLFKYLPDQDKLMIAIMVEHFDLWDKLGPEAATKYRRATAALSDPAIGGMFDSGGGAWMFEEATGKTYLYRRFALDAPAPEVNDAIDRMVAVVPAWTMRWTAEVARIAHGHRPPPARRVTLADDPYAGRL